MPQHPPAPQLDPPATAKEAQAARRRVRNAPRLAAEAGAPLTRPASRRVFRLSDPGSADDHPGMQFVFALPGPR